MGGRGVCFVIVILSGFAILRAQNDPIKVGEYSEFAESSSELEMQTRAFVERLAKEPESTRGAIAFINRLKFKGNCLDGRLVADQPLEKFWDNTIPKRLSKRVVLVGTEGLGLRAEALFYIVPEGAQLPGRLERDVNPPCCCSEIRVDGMAEIEQRVRRVNFSLFLPLVSKRTPPNPVWTVSSGKIVSGQGTKSIVVDLTGTDVDKIIAEVSITSPNVVCGCPTTASYTTRIRRN